MGALVARRADRNVLRSIGRAVYRVDQRSRERDITLYRQTQRDVHLLTF